MTTKTICGVEYAYTSPATNVIDIEVEGVLCASGDGTFDINPWEREDDSIDF